MFFEKGLKLVVLMCILIGLFNLQKPLVLQKVQITTPHTVSSIGTREVANLLFYCVGRVRVTIYRRERHGNYLGHRISGN